MASDLHLHSSFSDGSLKSSELFSLCASRGLQAISLVDHDRVDHLPGLVADASKAGLRLIPGVEISAAIPPGYPGAGKKVHVLGYHFKPEAGAIDTLCSPMRQARHQLSLSLIDLLQKRGYTPRLPQILERAKDSGVIYKQHIMADLVAQGQADGLYGRVYQEEFKAPGKALPDIKYVTVFDAIRAIQEDGGLAVLAHPSLYESWDILGPAMDAGLGGIETAHPSLSPTESERAEILALHHGLLRSGGSDYHGSYGDEPLPGTFLVPLDDERSLLDPHAPRLARARTLVVALGRDILKARKLVLDVREKQGCAQDLVTSHDQDSENRLRTSLGAQFPQDAFWGEESPPSPGERAPEQVWIADPIDGTSNFINLGCDFSLSLGFCNQGSHRFGLVYDPAKHQLYQGLGALPELGLLAQAWDSGSALGVRANRASTCDQVFLDTSLNSLAPLADHGLNLLRLSTTFRAHRSLGCASLALIRCGLGNLGVYLSVKLSVWDWAGAVNFLEACGGSWSIHNPDMNSDCSDPTDPNRVHALQRVAVIAASGPELLARAQHIFGPSILSLMHTRAGS